MSPAGGRVARLGLVAGAALCFAFLSLAVDAQQARKVYRIGYLWLHAGPSPMDDAFRKRLRELGWVEGRNIVIEQRTAESNPERLGDLAAELVRLNVDLIFATNTPTAQAAKKATSAIPIVFTGVADPLGVGLVASLARPGGNATGVTTSSVELSGKRLELFKLAIPTLVRVAVFVNPLSPQATSLQRESEAAARALGLDLRMLEVRRPTDFDAALSALGRESALPLLVLPDPMYFTRDAQIRLAALVVRRRQPAMFFIKEFVEAGGLMSYGVDTPDLFRLGADYVDRVLKGAKPSDLPVQQPTRFELVINLKTAKALGISLPQSLLLRADRVIE